MRTPSEMAKETRTLYEVNIKHGMSLDELEIMIAKDIQAARRGAISDTWRKAATEVSNCMKHYPEGGDPNGCLEGLACEFSANADGCGPDSKGDTE